MSPREMGGAEVRCARCGHLYNNPATPWPFAVVNAPAVMLEPISSIKTGG
jgi:hypothetical protein